MDDLFEKMRQIGNEHIIFQQALWFALSNLEIVLEVDEAPDGTKHVKELGRVEIVNCPDGKVLVRRAR